MIVIDASVAIKWYISEATSKKALDLKHRGVTFYAPDIVYIEVFNCFMRLWRSHIISETACKTLANEWRINLEQGIISLSPSSAYFEQGTALALKHTHPMADCLYLAMAKQMNAVLVTADQGLSRLAHIEAIDTEMI
jgi:predicted nucleic acid-binding protein